MDNELIGIWRSDPTDIKAMQLYGNVEMEFRENGELTYTIINDSSKQQVFMSYEIKGNLLITDQLSFPQKEITKFILTGDCLEIIFEGVSSRYIRRVDKK